MSKLDEEDCEWSSHYFLQLGSYLPSSCEPEKVELMDTYGLLLIAGLVIARVDNTDVKVTIMSDEPCKL